MPHQHRFHGSKFNVSELCFLGKWSWVECVVSKNLKQHSQRRAPRLTDCLLSTRQSELAEMRHPFETTAVNAEKLTTPNRLIEAVASPIPGNTKHRRLDLIIRHAREDVSDMMLN